MLEVASESNIYTLSEANKKYNFLPNSQFYYLDLCLTYGDISNLNTTITRNFFNYPVQVKNKINQFLELIKEVTSIRIWSSKSYVEDYLILLFIINLVKDININISVIFVDDYTENGTPYTVACFSDKEISKLIKFEKTITPEIKKEYILEWEKLIKENKELRVFESGKIVSKDLEYLDNIILKTLEKYEQTTFKILFMNLFDFFSNEKNRIGDMLIYKRIFELIKANKIIDVNKKIEKVLTYEINYFSDDFVIKINT